MTASLCIHCDKEAVLVTGRVIYPHRPDLYEKPFWQCEPCEAYCGCHPGTENPLGRPANFDLRNARSQVHKVLDPLWKDAWKLPEYGVENLKGQFEQRKARRDITRRARNRVYLFLASAMKLDGDSCHTGMFDIEQCRAAWTILKKQTPASIRKWAKDRHL